MCSEKCEQSFNLWESIKTCVSDNIDYLKCEESNSIKLHGALLGIIHQIDDARILYEKIESFCGEYDIDENTQANGYRSFLKIFDSAINYIHKTLDSLTENRSRILFRKSHYIKEIEACNQLLTALVISFKQLIDLHLSSENGNLFTSKKFTTTEVLEKTAEINQSAFYGRCLGFQYYDSIKNVLKFIAVMMASYSESYYSTNSNFMKTSNSIYNSGRYYFDPEMLANRIVELSNNASVDFCKNFWCLAESEVIHSIPFVNFNVKVNRIIKINPKTMTIPKVNSNESITIEAPGIIQARLLSAQRRCGMIGEKDDTFSNVLPKTKELLFHCHGGGFIAQSSKSHLVYLLEWAVKLNVPIISIDYSLAPQFPYPYALNEIFYAYCWALQNCELLGTTAEKIVLCGDSAGAKLCLSTLIKCIDLKIRRPDGIFIAYCPILVALDPSPSRLLSTQDPLIPYGFLIRCLKAYVMNNQQNNGELYETNKCENNGVCESDTDEKNLIASEHDLSHSSNKSDSFEEISCFECHQSDSDIKAYISNVSTASNDTLEGTSFLMEKCKDTLDETVSPIDSIHSAISFEKDLCSDASEKENNIHLVPSTSEYAPFVDNFIEKYSLKGEFKNSNNRKTSRTRSEENIIFDVSKDICVKNFQRKFKYAASSIAKTFSSTFEEITKNNHTITNIYESKNENDLTKSDTKEDFDFFVPIEDPLLSPFYVNDEILKQFPPTNILSLTLDSCLDDAIMFAKRLKSLNVPYTLDILDKLPHGFLNFARLSKEAHEGSKLTMLRIAKLLNLNLDTAKSFC